MFYHDFFVCKQYEQYKQYRKYEQSHSTLYNSDYYFVRIVNTIAIVKIIKTSGKYSLEFT